MKNENRTRSGWEIMAHGKRRSTRFAKSRLSPSILAFLQTISRSTTRDRSSFGVYKRRNAQPWNILPFPYISYHLYCLVLFSSRSLT
jgi:hypothetical protein